MDDTSHPSNYDKTQLTTMRLDASLPHHLLMSPSLADEDEQKPLPSCPLPASPTLTNPDMVLPDNLHFTSTPSVTSQPEVYRPPSPSYLFDRRQKEQHQRQQQYQHYQPHQQYQHPQKQSLRSNPATVSYSRNNVPPRKSAERIAVQQLLLPLKTAQYNSSDDALPNESRAAATSAVMFAAMSAARKGMVDDNDRRISIAASSIDSDDLNSMRIPKFAGLDDDTETLGDSEFEGATPSEKWYAGHQIEPPETDESAVTLMRAEMILANAKKRLNLMDQNLRGAREIVAPLTAANLKRATSLNFAFSQPAFYGRARYISQKSSDVMPTHNSDRLQSSNGSTLGPAFKNFSTPLSFPDRPHTSFSHGTIPTNSFSPSLPLNPPRKVQSQERLRAGARPAPLPLNVNISNLYADTRSERDASSARGNNNSHSSSSQTTTSDLREQMDELKGRISSLKERAREDSMRRRSTQSLRQASLSVASSVPKVENYRTADSPMESMSDISEEDDVKSVYEDARDQAHEDRDDAFDYANFFLQSSTGTFTRPRNGSYSSSDSGQTARGFDDQVPPTPQTPKTLRDIEQGIHYRTKSSESLASLQSFETAEEGIRSRRQTPLSMGDWIAQRPKDGRSTPLIAGRADSGFSVSERPTAKMTKSSPPQTPGHDARLSYISVPPSATSIAVSALLSNKAHPLGLKDKALIYTVAENLRQICEKLQAGAENDHSLLILRQRLEDAGKILSTKRA